MASLSQLTEGAVRGIRKTAEDPPRVSVLDVIGAITDLDSSNCSNYYRRLTEQFPEVSRFCSNFKFPGRGQRDTPVTCAKGVVTIVMIRGQDEQQITRHATDGAIQADYIAWCHVF